MKSVGSVPRAVLSHKHNVKQLRVFVWEEWDGSIRPQMFYITFDYYHTNQARTKHDLF